MSRAEGLRRAREGMKRVARKADLVWQVSALTVVWEVAKMHRDFTINDVWEHFRRVFGKYATQGVHNTSAMGPVMQQAKRIGVCRRTNRFQRSSRSTNHGNPEAVWKSLIYREKEQSREK